LQYVFRVVNDSVEQTDVSFIEKFRKSRFIAAVVTKSPTSLDERFQFRMVFSRAHAMPSGASVSYLRQKSSTEKFL